MAYYKSDLNERRRNKLLAGLGSVGRVKNCNLGLKNAALDLSEVMRSFFDPGNGDMAHYKAYTPTSL